MRRGLLARLLENYIKPAGAGALGWLAEWAHLGMCYNEAARVMGFPSMNRNSYSSDHGVPVMDACWC